MALMRIPLPRTTLALHAKVNPRERHPGLELDKFVPPPETQEDQKEALGAVLKTAGDPALLAALLERRARWLALQKADVFCCRTTGPLTLHLSRATALENAGICLHPLYGFAYLPGTGLKGMARAYAETVWFPSQYQAAPNSPSPRDAAEAEKAEEAWRKIELIFGWAPGSDKNKAWKAEKIDPPEYSAACGRIAFHDAWPVSWPKLDLDLVNNHHRDYYDGKGPPGDWESPNMVSFLAVSAETEFQFALAERAGSMADAILDLAREWLVGALVHEGAGAKTAAGYGSFEPIRVDSPACDSPTRRVFEATLELVTPAFLAGAGQQAEDCDLRPATLRGLLRWWWRTMHAAHIDPSMLASLESAVWGDTSRGGAIRLTLEPISTLTPLLYDKQWLSDNNALPKPANNKTTQGLWYHSFGMDDKRKEDGRASRQQRYYIVPGTQWQLKLTARASSFEVRNRQRKTVRSVSLTDPRVLLQQAQCALWLLCNFGGVGSKSRKGFGSLAVPDGLCDWSVEQCRQIAAAFRQSCQVPSGAPGGSPALEDMLTIQDTPTPWTNYWYALDQLAAIVQQFAQDYKHNAEKKALGMPRSLRRPVGGSFQPGPHVQKTGRHASPVIYHLVPGRNGLVVCAVAFPSAELPNDPTRQKSRRFLQLLLDHLSRQLPIHVEQQGNQGRTPAQNPAPRTASQQSSSASVSQAAKATPYPKYGEAVEATLVEDPKGKGRRFAEYEPLHAVGAITNASDVPSELKPGDKVTLLVHSITPAGDGSIKAIQFNWPSEALLKQREKSQSKGRGKGPGQGRKHR